MDNFLSGCKEGRFFSSSRSPPSDLLVPVDAGAGSGVATRGYEEGW